MKIIKWETVGQKLVKFKIAVFESCETRTKNTVFCDFYRKIQCFSNYFRDHIATQGHSHSIVPVGLGVRSNRTRLMPSTSEVIRATILCSTG